MRGYSWDTVYRIKHSQYNTAILCIKYLKRQYKKASGNPRQYFVTFMNIFLLFDNLKLLLQLSKYIVEHCDKINMLIETSLLFRLIYRPNKHLRNNIILSLLKFYLQVPSRNSYSHKYVYLHLLIAIFLHVLVCSPFAFEIFQLVFLSKTYYHFSFFENNISTFGKSVKMSRVTTGYLHSLGLSHIRLQKVALHERKTRTHTVLIKQGISNAQELIALIKTLQCLSQLTLHV